jgi:hypothetical protein
MNLHVEAVLTEPHSARTTALVEAGTLYVLLFSPDGANMCSNHTYAGSLPLLITTGMVMKLVCVFEPRHGSGAADWPHQDSSGVSLRLLLLPLISACLMLDEGNL